jgi:hypothetical protein
MDETVEIIGAIIGVIIFFGCLVLAGLQPYFEAKAFNDCTGGHATYFTAVFTELRVQDCKN